MWDTDMLNDTLLSLGLKPALIEKLDDEQKTNIVNFSMQYASNSSLNQMVLSLASMEVRGKKGAAFLAANGIASIMQLKELTAEQIAVVESDYHYHEDAGVCSSMVRSFIVENQQEKLSIKYGQGVYKVQKIHQYQDSEDIKMKELGD
jgi:hypothetical protein